MSLAEKISSNLSISISMCGLFESLQVIKKKGIKKSRITAVGYGEKKPIAKNENSNGTDNEEGRALNRRIELKILSKSGEKKGTVNKINVPDALKN